MHGLAEAFGSGRLSDEALALMGEDEMQATLTQLKGVGRKSYGDA